MSLRKSRALQMGRSNTDLRSALSTKEQRKSKLPLHASNHPYHQTKLAPAHTAPLPAAPRSCEFSKAASFSTFNSSCTRPFLRSDPAEGAISEHSPLQTASAPRVTKELEHKKATQETQLVHMGLKVPSSSKVDLSKIADIRRAIRRRYANRNDIRKIFNSWDGQSRGLLRPEDVQFMLGRIGVAVSPDEAQVLIATASAEDSGTLNIQDFVNLIFDDSDVFNMHLASLGDVTVQRFRELTKHYSAQQQQNRLKACLFQNKNRLVPLIRREDQGGTGELHYEQFAKILKELKIPYSEQSLESLCASSGVLDYESLLKSTYSEPKPPARKPRPTQILDKQKATPSQLETIFLRARTIRQQLRELMQSQDSLYNALVAHTGGAAVTGAQLEGFLIASLQLPNKPLYKKDLEAFLSSFSYNTDGVTNTREVARTVFLDDIRAAKTLHEVKRQIPPVRPPGSFNPAAPHSLGPLLVAIEQKMFTQGKQAAYLIFKKFDADNDGYVTAGDLGRALDTHMIQHSPQDVADLMGFLDEDANGYVAFAEFSKLICPEQNKLEGASESLNAAQPSTASLSKQYNSLKDFQDAHEVLRTQLKPDETTFKLTTISRFSATPAHQDTFVNHVPTANSGLFATEQHRFCCKKLEPLNIGAEDKQGLERRRNNRTVYLQNTQQQIHARVNQLENKATQMDSCKLAKKAIVMEEYELRNR